VLFRSKECDYQIQIDDFKKQLLTV